MKSLLKKVQPLPLEAIRFAQKNRCYLCGGFMCTVDKTKPHLLPSLDHLIPQAVLRARKIYEGTLRMNNKLYAHRYCNNRRGATPLTDKQKVRARKIFIGAIAYHLAKE